MKSWLSHYTLVILGFFALACSPRPDREKFPGPQGRTTDLAQSEATKAVMGGFDPAKKMAQVEGGSSGTSEGPTKVSGTVSLAARAKVRPGMYFFIAARSPEGGPPLAVKRLENAKFPYTFELSEADAMIPGRVIRGKVTITARLKKSSDPLAQDDGDLFGQAEATAGQQNIKITLE